MEADNVLGRNKLIELTDHLTELDIRAGIRAKALVESLACNSMSFAIDLRSTQIIHGHPRTSVGASHASHHGVGQLFRIFDKFRVLVRRKRGPSEQQHSIELNRPLHHPAQHCNNVFLSDVINSN